LKVTYTEEAVVDIVEAITYLNERNPTVAAKLDAAITRRVEGLAAKEFDGPVSPLPRLATSLLVHVTRSATIGSTLIARRAGK
jgi:plasmid stabilization system protein ParE